MFFFNDTATTEIYALSLHDALPIWPAVRDRRRRRALEGRRRQGPSRRRARARRSGHDDRVLRARGWPGQDRKSTRLNSSYANISYAVFCLKKKNKPRCTLAQGPPAY